MTNYQEETKPGQRLTFSGLLTEHNYHIEIPIIQRDYAQGRPGKEDVRSTFLDALHDYLQENEPNRDLDFIYGTLTAEEGSDYTKFIPLDGQQRLTTLFLLHWYLANKEGKKEELNTLLSHADKSKFTYETRTSSREFCDALVQNNLDFNNLKEDSLSKSIQDCNWYYLSWETDPTIQSMLVMLDAVHKRFKNCEGFYERLVSKENPVITFQFLDLEKFKLTDDLYIKMNARGKALTEFENFKAKFEQHIKSVDFADTAAYKLLFADEEKDATVKEYFSHSIDTDWANLFWNYRNKQYNFDDKIMNFVQALAADRYAGQGKNEEIKALTDKNINFTFLKYRELAIFDRKFILDFINILDALKNGNSKVITHGVDVFYYDEAKVFESIIGDGQFNYRLQIQFFAYCHFLTQHEDKSGLNDWMRVICNLTENTIYNRESEYINSVKSVNEMLPHSDKILRYMVTGSQVSGFNRLQINEEKIKAQLLLKSAAWREVVLKAEKHSYFKGQIGFLLNFSGIEEYYQSHGNSCAWNEEDDQSYFEKFNNYYAKSKAVFGADGPDKFSEYLWERALLTKGDYLLAEGQNLSFGVNNDRDIGWKRLLFDGGQQRYKDEESASVLSRRNLVKELFDDENFDISSEDFGFITIIDKALPEIEDWRRGFINDPLHIDYLKATKKYIRKYSDRIYLLSKERMSGRHVDYETYDFLLENCEADITPFELLDCEEGSGWDYPPSVFTTVLLENKNYILSICNSYQLDETSGQPLYEVVFIGEKEVVLPENISQVVENVGFEKGEDSGLYMTLMKGQVMKKITELRTALA